MHKSLHILL